MTGEGQKCGGEGQKWGGEGQKLGDDGLKYQVGGAGCKSWWGLGGGFAQAHRASPHPNAPSPKFALPVSPATAAIARYIAHHPSTTTHRRPPTTIMPCLHESRELLPFIACSNPQPP